MEKFNDVLVIGAGLAGIEASLLLADSGRTVYLVERTSFIGGNVIKYEEVFSNMECSTCMVAPKQQELLQNQNIKLLTLSDVENVKGSVGNFVVKVKKKARYVDMDACIGCNECFAPCPVNLKNEYEERLGERKAIYIPYPGTLPNVPAVDTQNCLRFNGKKDCKACEEACMFDAIDFTQKDEELELKVGAIIVGTGFNIFNPEEVSRYGYGRFDDVYTAFEFERLYASNGPTEGRTVLRNGQLPKSASIIHCVGRDEMGYCSGVCCMYSLKFVHYLKSKVPDIKISEFYSDICIPGKSYQKFYEKTGENGVDFIRAEEIEVKKEGNSKVVNFKTESGSEETITADMVILAPAIQPSQGTSELATILDIPLGRGGFFSTKNQELAPVDTPKAGIFVAGCAQGPEDIQSAIAQSEAAVGRLLSLH